MRRRRFLKTLAMTAPLLLSPLAPKAFAGLFDELTDVLPDEVASMLESGKKLISGFEDITPEQEHYIGRSVAAVILSKYPCCNHRNGQRYVNVMGQALAQASDRPETFGGYHFLILDSDEINALSAPGGFVFVTKGLLGCCRSEDAMASVLAHEIGHVQRKHGLQAIQKSRITGGATALALTGTATLSGGTLKEVTQTFDDSIQDITTTMIDSGYSRTFEKEADHDAVVILQRMGYDPNAIVDMLNVMRTRFTPQSKGFARTHPSPKERINNVLATIGTYHRPAAVKPRNDRFASMTKGL
ncbi:M48 family metalloprotease [Pseudodesulfovibrio methanolicus]|uniref:M48 family metalloprotease n=1 Tax=Pseudodesulfovibrio methanolicus TaxID=3126690 RepID=A0ABZ2ITX3_9BACT